MTVTDHGGTSLAERFDAYVLGGVDRLKALGYNPALFLTMAALPGGVVVAARRLLAGPRRTSDGFRRLYEMGELGSSVEFAVCLPWFAPLFTDEEVDEARVRLVLHEFPLDRRLAATSTPGWA